MWAPNVVVLSLAVVDPPSVLLLGCEDLGESHSFNNGAVLSYFVLVSLDSPEQQQTTKIAPMY